MKVVYHTSMLPLMNPFFPSFVSKGLSVRVCQTSISKRRRTHFSVYFDKPFHFQPGYEDSDSRLTFVQLAALGSRSLRVTRSCSRLLSWYPPFTPFNLKQAWGLSRMSWRFTANPAMSMPKGRWGSNTVFQLNTLPWELILGDSYQRPPTDWHFTSPTHLQYEKDGIG